MTSLTLPVATGRRLVRAATAPSRLAFAYALLASLWIVGSDFLLFVFLADGHRPEIAYYEIGKGLLFVSVTSVILYALLCVHARRERALSDRLQRAAEANSNGYWSWDVENDDMVVTPGNDPDVGWDAAETVHDMASWRAIVHPEDCAACESVIREALDGERDQYAITYRVRSLGGGWTWFQTTAQVLDRDPRGRARTIVGNYANVDALQRERLELGRTNRALDALVRANRVSSEAHDPDELLQALCDALMHSGAYTEVRVDEVVEPAGPTLRPCAVAGGAASEAAGPSVDEAAASPAATPAGDRHAHPARAVRRAIETGRGQVVSELPVEVGSDGARSVIAVPIPAAGGNGARSARFLLRIEAAQADAFQAADRRTYETLAEDVGAALRAFETTQSYERRLERTMRGAIKALAATVEKRDPYTAGHQERVADLSAAIAREMGLGADEIEGIHIGATMHDIGKIGVPTEILTKPGRLDDTEVAVVRRHTGIGYEIVKEIDFGWPVADIVHQHHERCDGSGYPHGLRGDQISRAAKIVAVADVIESMATHRPYRRARSWEEVESVLRDGRGVKFDAAVVDAAEAAISRDGLDALLGEAAEIGAAPPQSVAR